MLAEVFAFLSLFALACLLFAAFDLGVVLFTLYVEPALLKWLMNRHSYILSGPASGDIVVFKVNRRSRPNMFNAILARLHETFAQRGVMVVVLDECVQDVGILRKRELDELIESEIRRRTNP